VVQEKFFTKKSLGQNFLTDKNFLEKIIDKLNLSQDETVVEIGTGMGILTKVLAGRVKSVITYEVDKRLEPRLTEDFAGLGNVKLCMQDIMKAENFPQSYCVVANIPYYITSPIIIKFLQESGCKMICVLVQDEVARRICAEVGTKDYGALTVTVQTAAKCKIIAKVPRHMFHPAPKVDSAFVVIEKNKKNILEDNFVKKIFSMRRKKIKNSVPIAVLEKCGINPDLRAEQIAVDDFVKISLEIAKIDKT
jgi:16S rRNA (adenine1518-N6/adenine1519-N6)-dimethyltransferase